MLRRDHILVTSSLGSQKTLTSFHYGQAGARPKVYIQASLHAEELPGMLVAHHLRGLLDQAEAAGQILGEVVLVPVANPLGLAQRLNHKPMGRFDLASTENFNRRYPDLTLAISDDVLSRLGTEGDTNVLAVRQAIAQYLANLQPNTELESLRHTLVTLAYDADQVLDLHCDCEAVMHLYTEEPCWPALQPLANMLQCKAVLLAKNSGSLPFDECLSGVWWKAAERLASSGNTAPLPQACCSATVELRGESDVSHALAKEDARALYNYLKHIRVIDGGDIAEVPPPQCRPTPLSGSETLKSPAAGVLVFEASVGQYLQVGDLVAEVIDPLAPGAHPIRAGVEGVLYARVRDRYVVRGAEVGKVAGSVPFKTGELLGA